MFATVAALAVLASSAYAQSLNISQACQATLAGVAASPSAACLNPAGLIAALGTTSANASLVGPVNSWLTGLCSQQACSNQTISAIVTNVTTGCASDLSALGYQSSATPTVIAEAQQFYPVARELVCLKNTTSNNLCITDALNTIQGAVGTLSENNLVSIITRIIGGGLSNSTIPMTLLCSDCAKEAINVLNKDVPGLIPSSTNSSLSATCGASFLNGQTPSDVSQTAAGLSTSSNKSGALAGFPVSSILSALGALAAAFAFFA